MLSFVRTLFLLFIVYLIFFASPVFASCARISLEKQVERADIIALGRVVGLTDYDANISVERYFKGQGGPKEIIITGRESDKPGAITSVDFEFSEGKSYLLFLNVSNGKLKTNACTGTREVENWLTEEEVQLLGSGYSPTPTSSQETPVSKPANNSLLFAIVGVAATSGLLFFVWKKKV